MQYGKGAGIVGGLREDGYSALADAYALHYERFRRVVANRLPPRLSKRVDAADILQEGFLDAVQRLNEFLDGPPVPLETWLWYLIRQRIFTACREHLGTKKRDVRREEWSHGPDDDGGSRGSLNDFPALQRTPDEVAMRHERQQRLQGLLAALPPMDREIIRLRHWEELNNAAAAVRMGISTCAASKRYYRALKRLRMHTNQEVEAPVNTA